MLKTFISGDSREKSLLAPRTLPKKKPESLDKISTLKTPPKRKPRNTPKKKSNPSRKQRDESKPFTILLFFLISVFLPTFCEAVSETEWFPSENSEFLSINGEYLFSFDMLLSVGVLGWLLYLGLSQQAASVSDATAGVLFGGKAQVKSRLKLNIDSRGWQNLRRKLFMSPSPYIEVHKIHRDIRY